MKLFYIFSFLTCFLGCFAIYGRLLDLSPDLVPYLAAMAGWLIVVIERRASIIQQIKLYRKTK